MWDYFRKNWEYSNKLKHLIKHGGKKASNEGLHWYRDPFLFKQYPALGLKNRIEYIYSPFNSVLVSTKSCDTYCSTMFTG